MIWLQFYVCVRILLNPTSGGTHHFLSTFITWDACKYFPLYRQNFKGERPRKSITLSAREIWQSCIKNIPRTECVAIGKECSFHRTSRKFPEPVAFYRLAYMSTIRTSLSLVNNISHRELCFFRLILSLKIWKFSKKCYFRCISSWSMHPKVYIIQSMYFSQTGFRKSNAKNEYLSSTDTNIVHIARNHDFTSFLSWWWHISLTVLTDWLTA